MTTKPTNLPEFCEWCIQWIRDGAGDPQGRVTSSWIVATSEETIYGPLALAQTEESYYVSATLLADAVERLRAEFFAVVLSGQELPRGPGEPEADFVVVATYSKTEERHLMTRDGKNWHEVPNPGGAYTEIARRVVYDWQRGANIQERQQLLAAIESPLLDQLATAAIDALFGKGERVASQPRLVEVTTALARSVPKAKQKKLIRLGADYFEAWLPGSTSLVDGSDGRVTLVALLITQVASARLESTGFRCSLIEHECHGQVQAIHRDGLDLDEITDAEYESLREGAA